MQTADHMSIEDYSNPGDTMISLSLHHFPMQMYQPDALNSFSLSLD